MHHSIFTAIAASTLALTGAIPSAAHPKINPNGLEKTAAITSNISAVVGLDNVGGGKGEVMTTQKKYDCVGCIAIMWDGLNFKGRGWGLYAHEMGDSPDEGECTSVPPGIISSILFTKDNFNRRSVACYIFPDDRCADGDRKNWIGNDVADLRTLGFNKRIQTISCYWKGDESTHWKRADGSPS